MNSVVEQLKVLVREQAYEEAMGLRDQMPEGKHERIEFCRVLADGLVTSGHLAEADDLLGEVDRLAPNQVDVHRKRAEIARGMGLLDRCGAQLLHAFGLQPTNAALADELCAILETLGRVEEVKRIRREHRDHTDLAHDKLARWNEPARIVVGPAAKVTAMYLDLLERVVANTIYGDPRNQFGELLPYSEERRQVGRDIPSAAHTMIGARRLRHLRVLAEAAIREGVPGDFVETGVWRGGACILLAGVLRAHGVDDRKVVAADSFEGLPPPDPRYAKDALTVFDFHLRPDLAVDLETVRGNFERYGLLDDHVVFLPGYFKDTLPLYPREQIAILRMDGDLYSSTMDTLVNLYPRVASGGWIICDDYGVVIDARRAVLDFRAQHGISETMIAVDGDAVFWRKS